jgi:hypothetical protein
MASGGEDQSEMRRAIAIARRWLRLMVRVKLRMHLRRRIGMMRGVQMMGVRKMRMVRRIGVIVLLGVLDRFVMMLGRLLVMPGGMLVMLSRAVMLGHEGLPAPRNGARAWYARLMSAM